MSGKKKSKRAVLLPCTAEWPQTCTCLTVRWRYDLHHDKTQ